MKKYLATFIVVLFLLAGCRKQSGRDTGILNSGIKTGQLRPMRAFKRKDLINVGLIISVFEVHPQRWSRLRDELGNFDKLRTEYTSTGAFLANGLMLAGGDRMAWKPVSNYLVKAGTVVITQVNSQILEGMTGNVVIGSLREPETVYYAADNDVISGVGLDSGNLILRLEPDSLIGLRQSVRVRLSLLYRRASSADGRNGGGGGREFVFGWSDFNVRMSPGQFFILAPEQAEQSPPMLADTFFTPESPVPMVRFVLVTCNSIAE